MPSRVAIDDFLAQTHIAFVGVSRDAKQFANTVYRHLRDGGRTMYPVNRSGEAEQLDGDVAYGALADVPDPVDGVVIMVPVTAEAGVVSDAIARGIPRVWVHRASGRDPVADGVRLLCREAGVELVDGVCPLMFVEPVRGIHRVHRHVARRRFAA